MRHLRLVHSAPPSAPADDGLKISARRSMTVHDTATLEGERHIERSDQAFEPAVQALWEHLRIIRPLPRAVRERALARARAALAAPPCAMARPPSRQRRPWLMLLVSVTLLAVVGTAMEAFLTRVSADAEPSPRTVAPLGIAAY